MLTRSEFSALALAAQRDPQLFMEHCLWIATKGEPGQSPITRLALNRTQVRVHRAIMAQRRAGKPPRAIVLKCRQPGISTLGAGYMLATALCQPYSGSLLVAHLDDAVTTLFKRVQFMVDRLPPALKPSLGSTRRNEIVLDRLACTDGDIELRSLMAVASATGGEQWRGMTIQLCHLSEFAKFPRPEETLLGVLQAVPPHPQSLVLIESTAQGMGNAFQEEYDRAVAGESDFVPVFVAWHEVPEYRMPVPLDFELEPEERELKQTHHLSNDQLQWYRYALATQCQGNVERRAQEFPSTANEAFLVTGRPAFPVKVLREMADAAHHIPLCRCVPHHTRLDGPPHCERGVLTEEGKFVRIAKGPLAVYRRPVSGHDYTLGADPSAGIEGGDPACIQVFDRNTGEFVATWHGFENPVAFAHFVATLALWYNTAIVAPEVNNHGFTVVSELKNTIQYQRFYVWQRPDRIRNTFTNFYGWWSSYATRPILIDTFNFALTDRDLVIYDPETISEALKFQWMTQQRAEGLGHDDRCFSPGTPVETQRGPVAIEHVTLGEQVLSHDGQWHRVTGRGARLVEEALVSLRVTGLPDAIHVTAEHRFWVQRRFRSGSRGFSESRWTPASILQRGDRVWVPKRPLGPPLSLTSDELYLLGWYLADGNLTPAGGLRITCGLREEACAQRLASILEALVQSHPTHWFAGVGRRGRRRRASRVTIHHRPKWIEVCCQNRWLDEWLRRWVGPARQKYVHPEIAAASETLPFVMGFLEGDGSQDQARQALSAAQRDLRVLRVIQRMLLDQGIWAAVYRSGHQALSLLHVGSPWAQRLLDRCPSLRFRRPTSRRAHPIAEDGGAGYWTLIRDAERCPYVGPVFNLSVEGAESYTVDGVAAHNCMAAMIAYRVHIEMPLLSTGLPPRVRYAEFEKGTPPEGPKLPNFSEEAWRETDQTLEEMRRGPGNLPAQYGNDEPREGEEPPDLGLDYYPDILD